MNEQDLMRVDALAGALKAHKALRELAATSLSGEAKRAVLADVEALDGIIERLCKEVGAARS